MPPVTKNLIIINVLMFVASCIPSLQGPMAQYLSLHYYGASDFNLAQLITYMFMHGGFVHLFFNMFTLFMFGPLLEMVMGSKRYLIFYMVCGIGAALIQEAVWAWTIPGEIASNLATLNHTTLSEMKQYLALHPEIYEMNYNIFVTVGASGAIYGLLLAFGMLFPNRPLYMMFIPVPIKAKWMMCIWGGMELLLGLSAATDGVAHFAHLGGMIFGFMLIMLWKKQGSLHGDNF